jgi:hypothetical protein
MNNRIHSYVTWLLAILLLAAAAVTFALSLNHPVSADLAMLHYSAWLINEKSFVLYRDIFELNFPAPFIFHSLLGKWIGYEALPLRFVDLVLLMSLSLISWKILAPISRPSTVAATGLFILLYLINGGEYTLERDVLCLIPAAAAFMFVTSTTLSLRSQTLLAATFAAIACSMKPNGAVIVPALLCFLWQDSRQENTASKIKTTIIFLASMALIAVIPFLWVIKNGGYADFISIYKNFFPIYANSRYDLFHYDSTAERLDSLLKNYLIYGGGALLLSLPGLIWAWKMKSGDASARRRILQLAAMTFAFTLYELIAGKFWINHMLPSAYWMLLCFSLLLTSPASNAQLWKKILAIILLIPVGLSGYFFARTSLLQMQTAYNKEAHMPENWRARQIATFLGKQSLQSEDTVQVLDMAGDGQAALLQVKATSATRHLIDVPLYMEPDSPATKTLREEFIRDLATKKPQFIVYVEQFLHPGGGNRLREFKSLAAMIDQDYAIAEQHDGDYIIYRRK